MASSTFHITQFGYGVLGSAYARAFQETGNRVTIVEANPRMVAENKGKIDIYHMSDDLSGITGVDVIPLMICTPLKDGKLDMSYIMSSVPNVATLLRNNPDALVLIRSTVTPGTTMAYKKALEELLPPGQDVYIGMQPEFLRAHSSYQDARNPWQVVLGHVDLPEFQLNKFKQLYLQYVSEDRISFLHLDEAEVMKIFHNSFNAAKISFFNNCKLLCDNMNKVNGTSIDMNKIASVMVKTCEGLLNPHYGTKAGHGYYGTCLPKDSAELQHLEHKYGVTTGLFDAVVKVNDEIVKSDEGEVLVGDHHMSFSNLFDNSAVKVKVSIGQPSDMETQKSVSLQTRSSLGVVNV